MSCDLGQLSHDCPYLVAPLANLPDSNASAHMYIVWQSGLVLEGLTVSAGGGGGGEQAKEEVEWGGGGGGKEWEMGQREGGMEEEAEGGGMEEEADGGGMEGEG